MKAYNEHIKLLYCYCIMLCIVLLSNTCIYQKAYNEFSSASAKTLQYFQWENATVIIIQYPNFTLILWASNTYVLLYWDIDHCSSIKHLNKYSTTVCTRISTLQKYLKYVIIQKLQCLILNSNDMLDMLEYQIKCTWFQLCFGLALSLYVKYLSTQLKFAAFSAAKL